MRKFSLKKALRIFLTLFITVGLLNLLVFIFSESTSRENERWVFHTFETIDMSQRLIVLLLDAETAQRGYLLTEEEDYLTPYKKSSNAIFDLLSNLKTKTADNPSQQIRLTALAKIIQLKFAELKHTLDLTHHASNEEAINIVKNDTGKKLMDEARYLVSEFQQEEKRLLDLRHDKYKNSNTRNLAIILIFKIIMFVIIISIILIVKRRAIDPIVSLSHQAKQFKINKKQNFELPETGNEIDILAQKLREMNVHISNVVNELNEAKLAADKSAEIKSAFLANMSHEIRTPLNGIYGTLQLLSTEVNTAKGQAILDKTKYSATSLITIVNDILDFSKIEAGKIELENLDFRLTELMEFVLSDMGVQAQHKGLKLNLKNHTEHDFWRGDPVRIKQIITNLVSNAIKFTNKGYVDICLQLDDNDTGIKLIITDSGIGMSSEQLQRLFERFEQADKSTTRKFGGTGLGMSITKSLVELMGGDITVRSELGVGTQFEVKLPLQRAEPTVEESSKIDDVGYHFPQKRILVAEDNEINRMIIEEMLASTGAEVDFAENGVIALEKFKLKTYDLVLLDIQMPEMDGIDTCRLIKEQAANIPVIALTANVMSEDKKLYIKVGFDNFLGKPMHKGALLKLISDYLSPN